MNNIGQKGNLRLGLYALAAYIVILYYLNMDKTTLKKLISSALSIIILQTQVFAQVSLPLFDKERAEQIQNNLIFSTFYNTLPPSAFAAPQLYNAYKSALVSEYFEMQKAQAAVKKAYKYNADRALYTEPQASGLICIDQQCFSPSVFNRAMLRLIIDQATGADEENKKFKNNMEIMTAYTRNAFYALQSHGAHPADIPAASDYFTQILKAAPQLCDNDTYLADIMPGLANADDRTNAGKGKDARRTACQSAAYAMLALPLLDVTPAQASSNVQLVYKTLNKTYREDYGILILTHAVPSLMAFNTQEAYEYLEKFLLKDSLADGLQKGSVWQVLGKVLDIISIKAWVDKFTDTNNMLRGRGGRFLNNAGPQFQYIDEEAAKQMGYKDWQINNVQNGAIGYNLPYRTVWEDIGFTLASSNVPQANSIARKAVAAYTLALRQSGNAYNAVHTPLVLGALSTGKVQGFDTGFAVKNLYNLDWWDLNEGTQRRINNQMVKVAAKYGLTLREKTLDETKKIRAARNERIANLAVWADMLAGAVFATMLISSLPAIIKNTGNFVSNASRLRTISKAGKTNLLKTVSSNIKNTPKANPAPVKPLPKAQVISQKPVAQTTAQPKLSAVDFVEVKNANGTKDLVHKWTLQQQLSNAKTANYTTQIGGAGGGGANAAPTIKTVKNSPAIAGYHGPAKPYVQKAAPAVKNISDWQMFKVNAKVSLEQFLTNARSFLKTGIKRPDMVITGGALPLGTTVQLAAPMAVHAPVPQSFSSAASMFVNAKNTTAPAQSINTLKTAQAAKVAAPFKTAPFMLNIMAMPQITGILNQWHGGKSASFKLNGAGSSPAGYLGPAASLKPAVNFMEGVIESSVNETIKSVDAYLFYRNHNKPTNMPYEFYAQSINKAYELISVNSKLVSTGFAAQQKQKLDDLYARLSPEVAMMQLLSKAPVKEAPAPEYVSNLDILLNKRYIIIDDGGRDDIYKALTSYSNDIYFAKTVSDVISYIKGHKRADIVVLTDLLLANTHGLKVMEEVKEIDKTIPVITIGKQTQGEIDLLKTIGFDGGIPSAEVDFTAAALANILAENEPARQAAPQGQNANILNGKHFLIIDDSPRPEVIAALKPYSDNIVFTHQAQRILNYVNDNPDADIVLLSDFFLKGTNGYTLMLKVHEINPSIPVITIGAQRAKDITGMAAYGFAGAIPTHDTPFTAQILSEILMAEQNKRIEAQSVYTMDNILFQFKDIVYGNFVDLLQFLYQKAQENNLKAPFLTVLYRTLSEIKLNGLGGKNFSAAFWSRWDKEAVRLERETGQKIPISPSSLPGAKK